MAARKGKQVEEFADIERKIMHAFQIYTFLEWVLKFTSWHVAS